MIDAEDRTLSPENETAGKNEEMSMDEVLASIRKIIASDDEEETSASSKQSQTPEDSKTTESKARESSEENLHVKEEDGVIELTQEVDDDGNIIKPISPLDSADQATQATPAAEEKSEESESSKETQSDHQAPAEEQASPEENSDESSGKQPPEESAEHSPEVDDFLNELSKDKAPAEENHAPSADKLHDSSQESTSETDPLGEEDDDAAAFLEETEEEMTTDSDEDLRKAIKDYETKDIREEEDHDTDGLLDENEINMILESQEKKGFSFEELNESAEEMNHNDTLLDFDQKNTSFSHTQEGLLSDSAMAASLSALQQLKGQVNKEQQGSMPSANDMSLQALALQAMTPLLKEWLDKNLPEIVQKVVEQEIKKLVNKSK